jgi:hypothetical protein
MFHVCVALLFSLAHFFCTSKEKGDCELQAQFSLNDKASLCGVLFVEKFQPVKE